MNQEGPNNPMEWDEYGAAGSSSAYTISQVIPSDVRFPINGSQPDWIYHRAFDAVGAVSTVHVQSAAVCESWVYV
jgi:hypothetical protein